MNQERTPTAFLRLDIILAVCVFGLMSLGFAFIYSSGVTSDGIQVSNEWIRQVVWSASGFVLMVIFAFVDYRKWKSWAIPAYLATTVLLILVLLIGNYIKGTRAWLEFGNVGIQPSEFGKLTLIIILARWFENRGRGVEQIRSWLGAIGITVIPLILILIQPDMGTAMVYVPILLAMAFVAGVDWRFLMFPLLAGGFVIIGVLGLAWNNHIAIAPMSLFRLFVENPLMVTGLSVLLGLCLLSVLGWFIFKRKIYLGLLYGFSVIATAYLGIVGASRMLKPYQMMRFVVFLDPQIDPRGAGWHIIQSVTAVGSGGIFGKGFLQGTQSHYRYLPEQSTDFIFSILAEETGFIGSLLVFSLFSLIIIRSLYIAHASQDQFGTFIAVGVAAMMGFHVIQNIGMAIGVMPITGIPLFFLSYGGSSLWTALMSVGLLLSVHYHRYRT